MSEWISVEDRLPKPGEKVDILDADGKRLVGWLDRYSPKDERMFWYYTPLSNPMNLEMGWGDFPIEGTHWMPLPEPPHVD